jgi:putative heme-binding domain-containing protein
MAAKYLLGVTTAQLNKDHNYGGTVDNQLRAFEHIGVFSKPLPKPPAELERLADYRDAKRPLDQRARAYLHSNCSYCHRKWGGGNAEFQLLASLDLADMKAVGVHAGQGTFFMPDARVIAPGDPYRSVMFYRMAKLGPGRMPRAGSNEVDEVGVRLIHDWIAQLPPGDDTARARADAAAALESLRKNPTSADQRARDIDQLLATTGGALRLLAAVDSRSLSNAAANDAVARATQHPEAHVRDLFERFLPEEKRTKRLGNVIKPDDILALRGDAARGKKLFFDTEGIACRTCHKIQGQGGDVGPDLSEIGKKYDRAKILENILEPSKEIDPKFQTYLVATKAGQVLTGVVVVRTPDAVSLRDAQNKLISLPTADIEQLAPQQQSIMPDLLLRDMTAAQVADLVEFLSSLKAD